MRFNAKCILNCSRKFLNFVEGSGGRDVPRARPWGQITLERVIKLMVIEPPELSYDAKVRNIGTTKS